MIFCNLLQLNRHLPNLLVLYSCFTKVLTRLVVMLFSQYRDTVRQFIKGTDGFAGAFAERLCGSPQLYQVCSISTHQ